MENLEFKLMNEVKKFISGINFISNNEIISSDMSSCVFLIENNLLVKTLTLKLDIATDELENLNRKLKTKDMIKEWTAKNMLPYCIKIGKECRKLNINKLLLSTISEGTVFNKEEYNNMSEIDKLLVNPDCIPNGKFELLHAFHIVNFNTKEINTLLFKLNTKNNKITYEEMTKVDFKTKNIDFANAFIEGYHS